MPSAIIAFALKFFLSKSIIKKLAQPLIEELFKFLEKKAKDSSSSIDDTVVEVMRKAVNEFLAAW